MTEMSSIKNILRPKSTADINREIQNMTTFEFLNKFLELSIKGFKVSIKKRVIHFMLSDKGISKYHKYYWYIWGVWALMNILESIFFPTSMIFTNEGFFDYVQRGIWYVIIIYLFTMFWVMIIYGRYTKWKSKQRFEILMNRNQDILRNLLTQAQTIAQPAANYISADWVAMNVNSLEDEEDEEE